MSSTASEQFNKPVHLSVTSETENVAVIRQAVQEAVSRVGFSESVVAEITLAIDEAVTNVIRHGYDGQPGQPIELTIEKIERQGRKGLQFIIRDSGRQVDPETIVGRDLADIRPGGLGTHILKTVMDEVEYTRRQSAGMQLRLVKMIESSDSRSCGTASKTQEDSSDGK
ncbi:MAG: ATP-binding protein [Planctomycetota bacterium]|nr:MAG: ATP-binding protein [Planctomycetota bacterium]